MRVSCFPEVSAEEVKEVSSYWGGSARFCFQYAEDERSDAWLECVENVSVDREMKWYVPYEVKRILAGKVDAEVSGRMFRILCEGERGGLQASWECYYSMDKILFATSKLAADFRHYCVNA
jgi:hypothetical protein